ncbi:MAG: T9SS type A sorting domain-containing protein [Saprospiraceae bacterium]
MPETGTIDLSGPSFQGLTSSITFRFYGWESTSAAGTFSINDFTFNGSVALPIELISFREKVENNFVHLFWATATERNNSHFSIERSTNGRNFSEIGQVKGAGDSFEPREYSYTDERPLQGKNYYRLRQVDFDGKYSYSRVVTATFGKASHITLAPMPASENVRILLAEPAQADGLWQVFDMSGRLMMAGEMLAEATEQNLNISALPEGAYVLRLAMGQEVSVAQFRKSE